MHPEEKNRVLMDLTNKLCSVPMVYYAMYFFRKMLVLGLASNY